MIKGISEIKYLLDTCIFISNPLFLNEFSGEEVLISSVTIRELDSVKEKNDHRSPNARAAAREILKKKGITIIGQGMSASMSPDENIIDHAKKYQEETGNSVRIITSDNYMGILAKAYGIDFEVVSRSSIEGRWDSSVDEAEDRSLKGIKNDPEDHFYPNEYLVDGSNIWKFLNGELRSIKKAKLSWGLHHRNVGQFCLINALMDEEIKILTIKGSAGTGKTLLSLAAGLQQVMDGRYTKLLFARATVEIGNGLGFLPGTMEEKMQPWVQPIADNLDILNKDIGKNKKKISLKSLTEEGLIDIQPVCFMRGRSLPNQFIIIDEAQNLTRHEVKTLLTRVGEGSKVILMGDTDQIDVRGLTKQDNGLAIAMESFKNENIAGHIELTRVERSEIAELAGRLI